MTSPSTGAPDDLAAVPHDLPWVFRESVRVIVLDAREHLLLLHTRELSRPDKGLWWELPGGGRLPGESVAETAVRELREETGLVVAPEDVPASTWSRRSTFTLRGQRRVQAEEIVVARVAAVTPPLDASGRELWEHEDYIGHRWWSIGDLSSSSDRFYPGRLVSLLPAVLAGEVVDEPLELWN